MVFAVVLGAALYALDTDAPPHAEVSTYVENRTTVAGRSFRANTSYKDILRIHECDANLRAACFTACGQFELLLRNAISEELSHHFEVIRTSTWPLSRMLPVAARRFVRSLTYTIDLRMLGRGTIFKLTVIRRFLRSGL